LWKLRPVDWDRAFCPRLGFRLCGFDEPLYDPEGPARGEGALYFTKEL